MPLDRYPTHGTSEGDKETILSLNPHPTMTKEGGSKNMEEWAVEKEKVNDLEQMKEDLIKLQAQKLEADKPKEEPLADEVDNDLARLEWEAGKIKPPVLPKLVPIKTIRLDVEGFSSFMGKKFYRYKLDYDLYFEVNADSHGKAEEKIMEFLKQELPLFHSQQPDGKLENQGVEEFIPASKRRENEEYA